MDNKYIEQLRTHVKDALRTDNMRYQHTLGVANTSACLAMCHGADMNKAYIAGLLHDCAKCVPDDVKIAECEQFGLPISDIEFESPYLLHSKLGAYYAAHKYNVEDDEICSAIQWHTTGKPAMTLLEKIVFIADYFVIASGSNTNQIQAMVDNVEEEMFKAGFDDPKVEGYNTASWILLDYKDVIVHVFSEDDRAFYNIERIWRDGKEVDINSL